MPRLEQVMRGVKRTQAKGGKKGKKRLPILVEILAKLRTFWQNCTTGDAEMLWAAASVCFFVFFRSGELTVPSELGYDANVSAPELQ